MGSICVLATWLYLPVSCELHEWSSTDCQSRRLHSHRDQPLKRGCNSHTDRQATHANCVIYAEVSAHTPNGFRKLTRLPYCTITTASGMFVATAFGCQHISFPGARSPAYSSGRYTGEEGDSGRKIWQVSSDKPVARRRNVQYTSICIAHRRKIALMRSDMDHSFTCKLHHTCLYSPAAEHHRLLAGTHFTVPRKVEG